MGSDKRGLSRFQEQLDKDKRGCLCATFMEDSFRMINQWSEQKSYIKVRTILNPTFSFFIFLSRTHGTVQFLLHKHSLQSTSLASWSVHWASWDVDLFTFVVMFFLELFSCNVLDTIFYPNQSF